jgi:hypothetical protein
MRFGDAVDAVQEDLSEMGHEIKSFVSTAAGMGPAIPEEGSIPEQAAVKEVGVSPRQRSEAMEIISKFCQSYRAARVVPTQEELEKIWISCSLLQPNAVASVIYEHLSWANGELEWQPRLRILYLLECFYEQGGTGKDIATGINSHAEELLKHLSTEVPQTRDKAREVIDLLSGNQPNPDDADGEDDAPKEQKKAFKKKSAESAKENNGDAEAIAKKIEKKPEVVQDLLDLQSPSSSSSSVPATTQAAASVDLLGGDAAPSSPAPVVDLVNLLSAPTAGTPSQLPAPAAASSALPVLGAPTPSLLPTLGTPAPAVQFGAPAPAVPSASRADQFNPDSPVTGASAQLAGLDLGKLYNASAASTPSAPSGGFHNLGSGPTLPVLQAELRKLRPGDLQKQARLLGASNDELDEVANHYDRKEALIQLVISRQQAQASIFGRPLGNSMPSAGAFGAAGFSSSSAAGLQSGGYGGMPMGGMGANCSQPMGFANLQSGNGLRPMGAPAPAPLALTNGVAPSGVGSPQKRSTPYFPTAHEVQNHQSVQPVDPFAFAENILQDFTKDTKT